MPDSRIASSFPTPREDALHENWCKELASRTSEQESGKRMRRAETKQHESSSGFTMVEIAIAMTFLVTGLLGFVGAIVSSQVLARANREVNIANTAVVNVIEEFRDKCTLDFDGTLNAIQLGNEPLPVVPEGLGAAAVFERELILDETQISPPIDLDGIPDNDNENVTPFEATAAVLRIRLSWNGALGQQDIEYTVVLARGEL